MRRFDYSFLESASIPADLLSYVYEIGSLKTATENYKRQSPRTFTELEAIARTQSIKTSNAIEGIVTTDGRIEEIVNQNSMPLNQNEEEILGYRDALDKILLNHNNLDINEETIKDLHAIIFKEPSKLSGGVYKDVDNVIVDVYANGDRRIRFKPVSAKETPKAMEQLFLAYMDARDNASINRFLLMPCVILDFLCIHPFIDGNGRVSRLLTLLLLYRNGHDIVKYISFEEQIYYYKSYYYGALRKSSASWSTGENDYIPFIRNFIFTLYKCYEELSKRFDAVSNKHKKKRTLVESEILSSLLPLSKSDLHFALPEVSFSTIDNVLRNLLREGKIRKIEGSNITRYVRV